MVYENYKIYGPYTRKDGRQHIVAYKNNEERITISYPKFLVESFLQRYLTKYETIDHIDCDFTNNNIENLQILDKRIHAKLDAKLRC